MKLAIISDTHDNLATLEKAVEWMKKNNIEEVIHCGDICSPETLRWLSKNLPIKINVVFGNVDVDILNETLQAPNIIFHGETGKLFLDNLRIAFTHQPKTAKSLASSGQYDLVFYGHTHKPWEETIGQCKLINPGNLSNMLYKASFAVYNTKTGELELKILEKL